MHVVSKSHQLFLHHRALLALAAGLAFAVIAAILLLTGAFESRSPAISAEAPGVAQTANAGGSSQDLAKAGTGGQGAVQQAVEPASRHQDLIDAGIGIQSLTMVARAYTSSFQGEGRIDAVARPPARAQAGISTSSLSGEGMVDPSNAQTHSARHTLPSAQQGDGLIGPGGR